MHARGWLLVVLLLHAGLAEARFGKSGGGSRGSSHGASSVGSRSSSSGSSSSGGRSYFSGSYGRGYLWRPAYRSPWWVAAPPAAAPAVMAADETELRITVNAEFMAIVVAPEKGFTLGVNAGIEGDYFGLQLSAQNISVKALDGSNTMDNLQQVAARLSYAFLSGERGRLRGELGCDLIFAPDMAFFGGTLGFSGVVNIAGPLAFEASLLATVYPFWQLDGRAGLVVATGPMAIRVGWRSQLLDDRGLVDGVAHRDVFHGPTAGFGLAF